MTETHKHWSVKYYSAIKMKKRVGQLGEIFYEDCTTCNSYVNMNNVQHSKIYKYNFMSFTVEGNESEWKVKAANNRNDHLHHFKKTKKAF